MNLMTIKSTVGGLYSAGKFYVKDHAPQILMGIAIGSEVAAIGTSCYAMTKMPDIFDEHKARTEDLKARLAAKEIKQDKYNEELTKTYISTGVNTVKYWALPVALTGLSITSGLAAYNKINKKYVGAMASLTTMTEKFRSYRANVVEDVGKERDKMYLNNDILKAKAVRLLKGDNKNGEEKAYTEKEIEEAREANANGSLKSGRSLIPSNNPYEFEYSKDTVNPYYFNENSHLYNVQFVCNQQPFYWNNRLITEGIITLNQVLKSFGLDCYMSAEFDDIGWCKPEYDDRCDGFVDFGFEKEEVFTPARRMWKDPTPEMELMFKQNPDTDRVMLVMNCCDIRAAKKRMYGEYFGKGGKLEAKLNGKLY